MQQPAKLYNLRVAGVRISLPPRYASIAQLVEYFLGKEEVTGSIPVGSSTENQIVVQVFRGGSFENGGTGGLAERSIAAAWKAVIG